ncbi:phage tail protein [Oxalobacter aliiformigenes]|uniref:Phage tail protein n=1 Tax=Oxalobacter aliiformigenes TaxID=2946593 RepID=A0A9E9NSA6_9BURK|nr:phage tail protein [Oxalobacter aliiformigenes]WAV90463.1 phage tail protein [Oxalobacter aliiformigenes]
MSKLPEKAVLDGSKIPKTTTGEMKEALGELHDYLKELLGEDSGDKESARLALGIDLEELSGNIDAKADRSELSSVAMTGSYDDLKDKPDLSERGVPIGTVAWFAMPVPPAGYLKCDGAAVGRETCPELFAAIGTTFGAGDGETTFNLPDLIGRFAEGSATPGTMKEAGLPNIKGVSNIGGNASKSALACGALKQVRYQQNWILNGAASDINDLAEVELDASLYNPTYGKSDTVQPPALTLLPCIKAFDAAVDSGLIDITELANEMAGKADTNLSNLSATGKAKAAHLAMPSDHLIELNYVSGETYTAPADGYFAIVASTNDGGVRLENISLRTVSTSIAHRTWGLGTSIAVRKGDRVYADGFQATVTLFGFLYAEGSQP